MENQCWQLGQDALYLVSCALHDRTPRWDPEKDTTSLFEFCKFHNITAIAAMALEDLWRVDPPADPERMKPWKQAKEKAIRKNILLNAEREEILAKLEEMGCWYMPLKGSVLQFDYPKFGMRQMSDHDILFDENFREWVHDWMIERGYKAEWYKQGVEDVYLKPPVYNFEMHVALFIKAWKPEMAAYYEDIRSKMIADVDGGYGYHLSDEDFYIYLIAHAYKHFSECGTGLRLLPDIWVYTRKHPQLNWDYITGELEKLGAADFEQTCRQLAEKLLDDPAAPAALTGQERETLTQLLYAGAYGTTQIKVDNKIKGGGFRAKLSYAWARVFPSREFLSVLYPEVLEHRWLVPVIWVKRILRAVFVNPLQSIRELKRIGKAK